MKILQLCYKPPFPPVDGGTLAMNSVTQGLLAAGNEVKVLTVWSDKHPMRINQNHAEYIEKTRCEGVYIDLAIHPIDALIALLCGESYTVKRFFNREFDAKLQEVLKSEDFDIVQFESIFMAPYLSTVRRLSNARTVLRAHNVEHHIWRQSALSTKNPLKRWYLKKLALALRHYELEEINKFDGIACISPSDVTVFKNEGCRRPLTSIPFGIDIKPTTDDTVEPMSLFHIGSMDWTPNQEGVRWFLREVWPIVHKENPNVKLYLAGRRMPEDILNLHEEGVVVLGEVDDATQFMSSKQINIVPLLNGSGIRIKILEAMSLGKVVISTSIGASGKDFTDGEELFIADTPRQFANRIRVCVDNINFCNEVGAKAKKLISEKYANGITTQRFIDFYNKISPTSL